MFCGDATAAPGSGCHGASVAQRPASAAAIGKLQTVVGSVTITRVDAIAFHPAVGDPVYVGDLIDTGVDGFVAMAFVDGRIFHLYASAHMVLDEFICGAEKSCRLAVFRVVKGMFGFGASKTATAGRLVIDTPLARIRSTAPAAGFGTAAFGIFTFGLIHELKAASADIALLDDGAIDYRDLKHGVFEIFTKEEHPRRIIVDDPGETIVLRPRGSSVSVEQVANTPQQMGQLQTAFDDAYSKYTQGLQDPFIQQYQQNHAFAQPQSTGPSGSSTSPTILANNTPPPPASNDGPTPNNNPAPVTPPPPPPPIVTPVVEIIPPPPPPPPSIAWDGDSLVEYYIYPALGTALYTSPAFTVPASGIAGLSIPQGVVFELSVDASSITASHFAFLGLFSAAAFSGFEVSDLSHDPLISGVTIDSATNMVGLNAGDITFDSNTVWVNWEGLSFNTGTIVTLDLTFDPPLNPSQMSIAQTLDGSASPASNAATLAVADGTELALAGTINNTGVITVDGETAATAIGIDGTVTLQGGGHIELSDSNQNYIFGNGTLINVDNTISGGGDIGNGTLLFHNEGVIEAQGPYALIIDTGTNPFVNTGTLETNGGTMIIDSPVTGGGSALIAGGTLEFTGASDNNVSFSASDAGILALDHSQDFTGHISAFSEPDQIDLGDIPFSTTTTLDYTADASDSGGTLLVSDGTNTANIAMLGSYTVSSFAISSDGHGGTLVTDPASANVSVDTPIGSSGADVADGIITVADTDPSNTQTASFTPEASGYSGSFSLDAVIVNDGSASVGWAFSLGNDQIPLAAGQTVTQSYNVSVTDPQNPAVDVSQTASVSIGGPGGDNFVFQPGIGADTIANFNPQSDTIELNGFNNIQSVQELASLITNDAHGDAVIDLGHNDSITLPGMSPTELQAMLQSAVHLH
jgi:VCBS repeat-containing protein